MFSCHVCVGVFGSPLICSKNTTDVANCYLAHTLVFHPGFNYLTACKTHYETKHFVVVIIVDNYIRVVGSPTNNLTEM